MSIDDLKAAIERRGFLIRLWLPEEDRVKMIVMLGERSLSCEVSMEDLIDYQDHGFNIANVVENVLGRLTAHQHIVRCKQCREPILKRVNQELALLHYQRNPKPDVKLLVKDESRLIHIMTRLNAGVPVSHQDVELLPGTNMEEAINAYTEYRPVKYGPYLEPWSICPKCGNVLKNGTEEIIDD